ncbi:hypothetical protein L2719_09195 [Shewanella schlegeliana]|uniref:Bacterial Pleckstrin homology domain-containing protein n=1 Tax=Shewanella schlegeliana TaxID=190308 RepID=A0ABS1T105_9GAMM|nr:hypothetical protein [Shewanella schlegeliana]MBL4914467.1 hypothetical protein [Shewanella schlegeliana]MCL1109717.1 hypothetical protein [Shewanella schlegeliana]GIU33297.1 hypothetical protein TUM4433_27500 [Shewanella schlegeliana]
MSQVYALAPLTSTGYWSFIALFAILVGLLTFIYFSTLPNISKIISIGLLMLTLFAFSWVFYKADDSKLIIGEEMLTLDVPFYPMTLPLSEVEIKGIKRLDWQREPDLKLDFRQNGVGMAGYQLGWFRLSNKQKAFVAMSEEQNLVMIPTLRGYWIILSLQEPDKLLSRQR